VRGGGGSFGGFRDLMGSGTGGGAEHIEIEQLRKNICLKRAYNVINSFCDHHKKR
jgi:hypothetical protein